MLFSEMFSFKTIKMSPWNLKGDVLYQARWCSLWKAFSKLQVSWTVNVKEDHHHRCNQAERTWLLFQGKETGSCLNFSK